MDVNLVVCLVIDDQILLLGRRSQLFRNWSFRNETTRLQHGEIPNMAKSPLNTKPQPILLTCISI